MSLMLLVDHVGGEGVLCRHGPMTPIWGSIYCDVDDDMVGSTHLLMVD